jgi:hypothetical protein
MRLLVSLLAASALAAACSSPCMQVQQLLCQCQGSTQTERNSCEDAASAQENLAPPDAAQLAACEALIPECEALLATGCAPLETPAGRAACGLSFR